MFSEEEGIFPQLEAMAQVEVNLSFVEAGVPREQVVQFA
jgi:hypothetical protein